MTLATILALAGHRSPDGTICPSDAARSIGGSSWRDLVPDVRERARQLARDGRVQVTQKGEPLDPDAEYVVYCRSGNRSATGRDILKAAGFENVTSMAGGINEWKAAGYATVSGE